MNYKIVKEYQETVGEYEIEKEEFDLLLIERAGFLLQRELETIVEIISFDDGHIKFKITQKTKA